MKRWRDPKTFIPLISVIFILLAGMAMTGCAVTGGALITAAYEGQTPVIKDLLNKGADVNERGGCGLWERGGDFDATPLLCASLGGHMEAVKELIDRGADVNARTNSFAVAGTPLTAAASARRAEIAKFLIEKGADVEYAMAQLKKREWKEAYEFLERLAKKQQPPRYRASPPTLPTALPLPTEPAVPF